MVLVQAEWKRDVGPKDTCFLIREIMEGRFATKEADYFQPNMAMVEAWAGEALCAGTTDPSRPRPPSAPPDELRT